MALPEEACRFIHDNVDASSATLETGCGLSTVVFALTGARHMVIAPIGEELDYLKRYCRERGISTERLTFIASRSQAVLPTLEKAPLDLVLIDGSHGFPAPYIDWYYTAGRLKKGGYLIVDDTWLWSCEMLRNFLAAQPQWKLVAEYRYRTAVFRKLEDGSENLEWVDQPLVATGGRMKRIDGRIRYRRPFGASPLGRALGDVRKGDFRSLRHKLSRVIARIVRRRS